MNLTKYDKEAFVNAVIADIPTEDYDGQIVKALREFSIVSMPPALRSVFESDPAVEDYIDTQYICVFGVSVRVPGSGKVRVDIHSNAELNARLGELKKLSDEQQMRISEMRSSLKGIIGMCRTLKQAKARLPEFEKYLPAERGVTGTTNLPVANLVADLTKLGWPKGERGIAP